MKAQVNTKKKISTLKNQAWANLICGAMTLPLYTVMLFQDTPQHRTLGNIFIVAVLAGIVVFCILSSGKKEAADELSTSNMNRAGSISAFIAPCIILAVGIFMHLRGNYRGDSTYDITGGDICVFSAMLMIINNIVKNGIFLWLDRTPKGEEE